MGFAWHDPPDLVFPQGVTTYVARVKAGIVAIAIRRAPDVETWMRVNAPWQDRSSLARQTLHAEVEVFVEEVVIWFSHGMFYGWWLEGVSPAGVETMQGGKYAIIGPALDTFAPVIFGDVEQLLRG